MTTSKKPKPNRISKGDFAKLLKRQRAKTGRLTLKLESRWSDEDRTRYITETTCKYRLTWMNASKRQYTSCFMYNLHRKSDPIDAMLDHDSQIFTKRIYTIGGKQYRVGR